MGLTVEPLTPAFGARVSGFSIRGGFDDRVLAEIEAAFEEYSVLYFPSQPVDDDEQISFSERLGVLEGTLPGAVGAGTKVARITNVMPDGTLKDPNGQQALFTRANIFWHTDSSFKPVPAKASLLSARRIPNAGGDTEFASTRAAYESLPPSTQARLEGLIVIHDIAHSRAMLTPEALSAEQRAAMPPVEQSLLRANPVNGRKSLLIGSHTARIKGWSEADSKALLEELMAATIRPEHTYRHKWTVGDIVMWDNRAVLHRGHEYDEINDRRLMIRTTLAGYGPTVVDGAIQAEL
ncbi:MAG: TauD/TfdA family dioxygenase [Alphaproteobacteria bacterium]|nr:TauD/TfdA family dioxygenase [Alphaproteobacteria bacterium]